MGAQIPGFWSPTLLKVLILNMLIAVDLPGP